MSSSFLSKSQSRMYVVIEQLFEDLNSYCESFVALPEALPSQLDIEIDQNTLSFTDQLTSTDQASDIEKPLISGFPTAAGSHNAQQIHVGSGLDKATESVGEALEQGEAATPVPNSEESANINQSIVSPIEKASTEQLDDATGNKQIDVDHGISDRKEPVASLANGERDLGRKAIAPGLSGNATESGDPVEGVALNLANSESDPSEGMLSSREVDISSEEMERTSSELRNGRLVSDSVGAIPPAPMLAPGKREPPHGLGRTVRDAINLKLFPTYPNPAEVNDWDVPVTLLDLRKRMTGNWDLTMCRVLPFIDGVNHVKRIAQLADADLELTRQCIEHLLYYRCIITTDIFQFTNMYTIRPSIATMAEDEVIISECASYVIKPGYKSLSWPKLLSLYSTLRPAVTIIDWIETHHIDELGIDARRFVSFGIIKGFLRRVHRYPVLIGDVSGMTKGTGSQIDLDTNRNDSNSRSRERVGALRQSDSTQQLSPQMSIYNDIGSPVRGRNTRLRYPSENDSLREGGVATSIKSMASHGRRRYAEPIQSHRKVRATVVDAANVALEAAAVIKEQDRQSMLHPPPSTQRISIRTPLPRGGSSSTIRGIQSNKDSEEYAASRRASKASVQIPPGLVKMLDGTHPDDEFCVKFGLSWNEIFDLLVIIGKQSDLQTMSTPSVGGVSVSRRKNKTVDRDEDVTVTPGEADESGIAGWSGFTLSGHRKSLGSSLPRHRGQNTQASSGSQSGFSRYASTGENVSGRGRMSNLQNIGGSTILEDITPANKEALAKGDLGKVKIIVK